MDHSLAVLEPNGPGTCAGEDEAWSATNEQLKC